jgi:hypothetical protein
MAREGKFKQTELKKARKKLDIDPDKTNPLFA